MSSLDTHGAAYMAEMMPQTMQELGTIMHKTARQFAVTVGDTAASGDLNPALNDLSKLMQQCVACHAAFRVH